MLKIDPFLKTNPLMTSYHLFHGFYSEASARLEKEGFSFIQAMILTGVFFENREGRDCTPHALTESLQISSSSFSHFLKPLVRDHYLKRQLSPSDARKVRLKTTSKGRNKALRLIKILDSIQERLEEKIGERRLRVWNRRSYQLIELSRG